MQDPSGVPMGAWLSMGMAAVWRRGVCVCVYFNFVSLSVGGCVSRQNASGCVRVRRVVSGGSGTSVCYLPCSPNLNVQVTKNTIVNLSHRGQGEKFFRYL